MNPPSKQEMSDLMREKYGSPEKQARVTAIMSSSGMQKTLQYEDNDPSHGLVSPKPRLIFGASALRKEEWKPKTTLKWEEPYRTPLTL